MNKHRILIMDDETILRNALGRALKEFGYETVLTCEGNMALEEYAKALEEGRKFDVVILDLTVPGGMGGKETMGKLLEKDPEVKAIVSSGYANDSLLADFQEAGFSGVVTKPYKIMELENTITKVIDSNKTPDKRP